MSEEKNSLHISVSKYHDQFFPTTVTLTWPAVNGHSEEIYNVTLTDFENQLADLITYIYATHKERFGNQNGCADEHAMLISNLRENLDNTEIRDYDAGVKLGELQKKLELAQFGRLRELRSISVGDRDPYSRPSIVADKSVSSIEQEQGVRIPTVQEKKADYAKTTNDIINDIFMIIKDNRDVFDIAKKIGFPFYMDNDVPQCLPCEMLPSDLYDKTYRLYEYLYARKRTYKDLINKFTPTDGPLYNAAGHVISSHNIYMNSSKIAFTNMLNKYDECKMHLDAIGTYMDEASLKIKEAKKTFEETNEVYNSAEKAYTSVADNIKSLSELKQELNKEVSNLEVLIPNINKKNKEYIQHNNELILKVNKKISLLNESLSKATEKVDKEITDKIKQKIEELEKLKTKLSDNKQNTDKMSQNILQLEKDLEQNKAHVKEFNNVFDNLNNNKENIKKQVDAIRTDFHKINENSNSLSAEINGIENILTQAKGHVDDNKRVCSSVLETMDKVTDKDVTIKYSAEVAENISAIMKKSIDSHDWNFILRGKRKDQTEKMFGGCFRIDDSGTIIFDKDKFEKFITKDGSTSSKMISIMFNEMKEVVTNTVGSTLTNNSETSAAIAKELVDLVCKYNFHIFENISAIFNASLKAAKTADQIVSATNNLKSMIEELNVHLETTISICRKCGVQCNELIVQSKKLTESAQEIQKNAQSIVATCKALDVDIQTSIETNKKRISAMQNLAASITKQDNESDQEVRGIEQEFEEIVKDSNSIEADLQAALEREQKETEDAKKAEGLAKNLKRDAGILEQSGRDIQEKVSEGKQNLIETVPLVAAALPHAVAGHNSAIAAKEENDKINKLLLRFFTEKKEKIIADMESSWIRPSKQAISDLRNTLADPTTKVEDILTLKKYEFGWRKWTPFVKTALEAKFEEYQKEQEQNTAEEKSKTPQMKH